MTTNIKKLYIVIVGLSLISLALVVSIGILLIGNSKEVQTDNVKPIASADSLSPTSTNSEQTNMQPTKLDTTASLSYGKVKAEFSYPSEYIPESVLCFESVKSKSKVYCEDTSKFNIGYDIPVGEYYAYTKASFDNDWGKGLYTNDLTECTYEGKCAEWDKEQESYMENSGATSFPDSSTYYNYSFGGRRIVFNIETDKLLDMGTIEVSGH